LGQFFCWSYGQSLTEENILSIMADKINELVVTKSHLKRQIDFM
jgi:hypothetical protein